jgi:hypothetical protein
MRRPRCTVIALCAAITLGWSGLAAAGAPQSAPAKVQVRPDGKLVEGPGWGKRSEKGEKKDETTATVKKR